MYRFLKSGSVVFCLLLMTGCSQKLPLVSHAHVGHALTAWRDTPNEQGLFIVAEKETRTALDETNAAITSGQNQSKMKGHLSNVLYALNPDLVENSKGSGYGTVRALNGATDHMVFAAESDDASRNLENMAYEFAEAQVAVMNRIKLAVEVTRLAQQSHGQEQQNLLLQLRSALYGALEGEDVDHNGKIGPGQEEYGLLQLREIISTGLRNEKPTYHPVEKRYLFGLIRLPTGTWAYRFNASAAKEDTGHDGPSEAYGYNYEDYKY